MCHEQYDRSLGRKVHLCVIFGAENVEGQNFPCENRFFAKIKLICWKIDKQDIKQIELKED